MRLAALLACAWLACVAGFAPVGPTAILLQGYSEEADIDTAIFENGACNTPLFAPGNDSSLLVATVSGGVWWSTNINDPPDQISYMPLTDGIPCNGARGIAFDQAPGPGETPMLCVACGGFGSNWINTALLTGVWCNNQSADSPQTGWYQLSHTSLNEWSFTQVAVYNKVIYATASALNYGLTPGKNGLFRFDHGEIIDDLNGNNLSDMLVLPPLSGNVPNVIVACPSGCVLGVGIWNYSSSSSITPNAMVAQLTNECDFPRILLASDSAGHYIYAMVMACKLKNNKPHWSTYLWGLVKGAPWASFTPPDHVTSDWLHAAIAVYPADPNVIFIGGAQLFRDDQSFWPQRGGVWYAQLNQAAPEWKNITNNTGAFMWPHADTRGITFNSSGALYLCTDGGLYVTTTPLALVPQWTYVGGDIVATEVFGAAANPYDPSDAYSFLAASQDNGVAYVAGDAPVGVGLMGGDGMGVTVTNYADTGGVIYYWTQAWDLRYCVVNSTKKQTNCSEHTQYVDVSSDNGPYTTYNNGSTVGGAWNPTLLANRVTPGQLLLLNNNTYVWESSNFGENWTLAYNTSGCIFWWESRFFSPKAVYGGCQTGASGAPDCNPYLAIIPCGNSVYMRYDSSTHWHHVKLPPTFFEDSFIAGIAVNPRDWTQAYFLLYDADDISDPAGGAWTVKDILAGTFDKHDDGSVSLVDVESILGNLPSVVPQWFDVYFSLYQIEVIPTGAGTDNVTVLVSGKGGVWALLHDDSGWSCTKEGALPYAPYFALVYQENASPAFASAFSLLTLGSQGRGVWALYNANDTVRDYFDQSFCL